MSLTVASHHMNTGDKKSNSNTKMLILCDENLVSIYPSLPILCFLATVVNLGFCLGLVLYPFVNNYQGSLTFVSQGMNYYCGWSGAVLGPCGMFIALCEIVVSLHTSSNTLITAILIQAVTWCIIIGVSGTGWAIHYTALVIFLASTFYFHWMFSNCHPMAPSLFYQKTNVITAINIVLFALAFVIQHTLFFSGSDDSSNILSDKNDTLDPGTSSNQIAMDITVSLEITLVCCVSMQQLCVGWVLHQYKNIHIVFENDHHKGLFPYYYTDDHFLPLDEEIHTPYQDNYTNRNENQEYYYHHGNKKPSGNYFQEAKVHP